MGSEFNLVEPSNHFSLDPGGYQYRVNIFNRLSDECTLDVDIISKKERASIKCT